MFFMETTIKRTFENNGLVEGLFFALFEKSSRKGLMKAAPDCSCHDCRRDVGERASDLLSVGGLFNVIFMQNFKMMFLSH